MAIKFASNGLFRAEVGLLIENPRCSIKPEEKEQLVKILEKLEELACKDAVEDPDERFVAPYADLRIGILFLERSMDPERSAQLFHEIHGLIKDHFVSGQLYRRMGRALEELGVKDVNRDLEVVIKEAKYRFDMSMAGYRGLEYSEEFCPSAVVRKENSRGGGRERR